ncbi:MAG: amylo-alpha-1,6-glucosidase [Bacillota bacterium]
MGRQAWPSFDQAAGLEWLETNGLGGWAYGTVGGASTRFYHAMLAASVHPPTERIALLARLEEAVCLDGVRYPLYTNRWASGHTEAEGLTWLQRFALAPFPTWIWTIGEVVVEKRLFMRHGQNTTVVRYRVWRGAGTTGPVTLELTPLVTCRSIHAVHRQSDWPFAQERLAEAGVAVEPFVGSPRLYMAADQGEYEPGGEWVRDLFYPYEVLRGEATVEDLYRPGRFRWRCAGAGELTFAASVEPLERLEGSAWERAERERRRGLLERAGVPDGAGGTAGTGATEEAVTTLVLAADQFIVQRASTGRATVIAGYPWFTDWGRDTMIALPGLTLATGRPELARELLQTFAAYERDGLIPNHFPEQGGEPLYNTADASLWYFEAVARYLEATGDHAFVREEIYPVLTRMAEAHLRGTHFGIGLTEDGLLRCGNPSVQVTWMDAKIGDWVVTPRDGKPVEIQALWYNALRVLAGLADRYGETGQAERWQALAGAVESGFTRFWNQAEGCLHDLLRDDGTPDPAIRPNQLFALTLTHPLLSGERARSVVDVVFRELYTPCGLRSLSPRDPAYAGRYEGTRLERDAVYHQGTVWAWLTGPFVRAYLQAYGRDEATLAHARALVEPLISHLTEFGLGSVAEIFDGDPPHTPRGCPAQAWSVAELLWLLTRELV